MWPGPHGQWSSRKHLLAGLDQSLRRLGLDYVDIFYSHRFDPDTPLEETMGALDSAVRPGQGPLRRHLVLLGREDARGGRHPPEAWDATRHPPAVLLAAQQVDRGGAARHARRGGGRLHGFTPLALGLLTDKYLDGIPEGSRGSRLASIWERVLTDETLAKIKGLDGIAAGRGQTLAQMALAWVLRDDRMTSTVFGARASLSSRRTWPRSRSASSARKSWPRSTASRPRATSTSGLLPAASDDAAGRSVVTGRAVEDGREACLRRGPACRDVLSRDSVGGRRVAA